MRFVACCTASRQNLGISRVVDEHGRFDAEGSEALLPLAWKGFYCLAEIGDRIAGREGAADAPTISSPSGSRLAAAIAEAEAQ